MARVAVLGIGAMGSRIARNLLAAGHAVRVYNRSPEQTAALQAAGAIVGVTPREAADGADVVISMVRDVAASREVWLAAETGALYALQHGTTAIESSTVSSAWIGELAAAVATTSAEFLDAPVLGTRPQAEAGQLIYLVGGEVMALERVREPLQATASAFHHIGAVGAGTAMKLAVNAQYAVQVAIWAETMVLLERQGITAMRAVEVLNTLPTTSPALQVGGKLMAIQNYAPMFPIELVAKDLNYAQMAADALEIAAPTLAAVRAVYADAVARGYGNDNIVGVKQLFDRV